MKNALLILLTLFLANCTSDDSKPKDLDERLLGKWKLIEQLADPGDGSGTFIPVNSDRTIEFFGNGKVTTNGALCYMSIEVGAKNSGTYKSFEVTSSSDGEIIPNNCDFNFVEPKVLYKIEGSTLILWYQCIEGCGQRFKKIE